MIELFSLVLVFVAFLFFWMSMKLKGTWSALQIIFIIIGFIFIITSGAFMGVVAVNTITTELAWSFMSINILMLIVVVMAFMLFFIKDILKTMSEVKK